MNDLILVSTSLVSLGIRSISAYLKDNGYSTRCVFLDQPETRLYGDNTLHDLERLCEDSQIVGISGIQAVQSKTQQVIETLRSPGRKIIVGGYDATLAPQRYDNADYVCRGYGEKIMLDLVRKIEIGDFPEQRILPVTPVLDLNVLPAEDYDNSNHFTISEDGTIIPLEELLAYKNPRASTNNSLFYVTARGCPYQCTFCEEPNFVKLASTKKAVRLKKPNKVIEEIEGIKADYPEMDRVYFMDPEFFSRPISWIKEFSALYKENIDLPFWVFGYPTAISEEKLSTLVDAGLTELQMGIQSGSDRTRREDYQRNTSNERIMQTMNLFYQYGVYPWIDIIFDNPFESRDDLLETIDLLVALPKPFKLGSFGLEFLPGTPLTKRAEKSGLIQIGQSERNLHNRKVQRDKNIYLNSLIRLMAGDCNEEYLGIVPTLAIPTLKSTNIIDFMDNNPQFAFTLDSIIKSKSELMFEK
jgi:anaerobic magnesium-protoporphyrin IX monomethyl ester cyclase